MIVELTRMSREGKRQIFLLKFVSLFTTKKTVVVFLKKNEKKSCWYYFLKKIKKETKQDLIYVLSCLMKVLIQTYLSLKKYQMATGVSGSSRRGIPAMQLTCTLKFAGLVKGYSENF